MERTDRSSVSIHFRKIFSNEINIASRCNEIVSQMHNRSKNYTMNWEQPLDSINLLDMNLWHQKIIPKNWQLKAKKYEFFWKKPAKIYKFIIIIISFFHLRKYNSHKFLNTFFLNFDIFLICRILRIISKTCRNFLIFWIIVSRNDF